MATRDANIDIHGAAEAFCASRNELRSKVLDSAHGFWLHDIGFGISIREDFLPFPMLGLCEQRTAEKTRNRQLTGPFSTAENMHL